MAVAQVPRVGGDDDDAISVALDDVRAHILAVARGAVEGIEFTEAAVEVEVTAEGELIGFDADEDHGDRDDDDDHDDEDPGEHR